MPRMTVVLLIAMTSISWLIGENPIKGIVITMLGILVASIGMDTLSGVPRYDFGNIYLLGGITFTPFVIGCVGFAQVIKLVNERKADEEKRQSEERKIKLSIRGSLLKGHDFRRILPPILRSGVLGTFVGVLPGSGATTGSMVGYAMQKKFKSEEPMGTGAIEGIAASEAGNNAAAAGAFAPLLALGIPGSGTGAVLLGGLMMWGLNPGPLLFDTNPEFCWSLISSLYLANVFTLLVAILIIPVLINILSVPVKYMIPIITCVCIVGAYSTSLLHVRRGNHVHLRYHRLPAGEKRLPHRPHAAGLRSGAYAGGEYAQGLHRLSGQAERLCQQPPEAGPAGHLPGADPDSCGQERPAQGQGQQAQGRGLIFSGHTPYLKIRLVRRR